MAALGDMHPLAAICFGIATTCFVVVLIGVLVARLFEHGGRQRDDHEGGLRLPKAPRR